LVRVLFSIRSVAVWPKPWFWMAPPKFARLLAMRLLRTVVVPMLKMPPPPPAERLLTMFTSWRLRIAFGPTRKAPPLKAAFEFV
jgi:hypothetical protein